MSSIVWFKSSHMKYFYTDRVTTVLERSLVFQVCSSIYQGHQSQVIHLVSSLPSHDLFVVILIYQTS